MKFDVARRMPPPRQVRPPRKQILPEEPRDGGAPPGAVLGLSPFLQPPAGQDLGHPREPAGQREPAQPPDLLVADGEPVLQAHDHGVAVREDRVPSLDPEQHLPADRLHRPRRQRPAGRPAAGAGRGVAGPARPGGAPAARGGLVGEDAPVGLDLGHRLRARGPAQRGRQRTPCAHAGRPGHACFAHLLAPGPRAPRLVEAHRGHGRGRERIPRRRDHAAAAPPARPAEEVAVEGRGVPFVGGVREAFLVAGVRVELQVEFEHLRERPGLGLVGFLRVEVQQEPPQAVRAPALGRDVAVHPGAGVADRRERPAALAFVVVVEPDGVGAAAVLAPAGPRRALGPRPSHPPPPAGARGSRRSRAGLRPPLRSAPPRTSGRGRARSAARAREQTKGYGGRHADFQGRTPRGATCLPCKCSTN